MLLYTGERSIKLTKEGDELLNLGNVLNKKTKGMFNNHTGGLCVYYSWLILG